MSNVIAFFDFDGTLTKKDTLLPFLRFIRGRYYYIDLLLALPWLAMFALKLLPNYIAKERLLRVCLKGWHKSELSSKAECFAEKLTGEQLNKTMLDKLVEHQSAGHVTVIVSASLDIYLEHWAKLYGFDFCLCSHLDVSNEGYLSGFFKGANCYGNEKVKRIESLMESFVSVSETYAYGDTRGDYPMLRFADNGYLYQNGRLLLVK